VDPQNYPQQAGGPSVYGPAPTSASPVQTPPKRNTKLIIIIAAAVAVLLIIGIAVIMVLSSTKKETPSTPTSQTSNQDATTQPATSVGVEQLNSSVSQDLSSLNDDKDLPSNQLDDKSLGL